MLHFGQVYLENCRRQLLALRTRVWTSARGETYIAQGNDAVGSVSCVFTSLEVNMTAIQ